MYERGHVSPGVFVVLVLIGAGVLAIVAVGALFSLAPKDTYEVEHTDYNPPPAAQGDVLVDDRLEDKKPVPFDPQLVERRPLGKNGEWLVNSSSAVVRLDVLLLHPDSDQDLLALHGSCAEALGGRPKEMLLPSVNLLDGKAKQFDDGLYAALDQAYYEGVKDKVIGHVDVVRRLYDKVGPNSVASPFLAAGLELAGVKVEGADAKKKEELLAGFRALETESKPIGFYTWSDTLSKCFQFLRFFQHRFRGADLHVPVALAQALAQDKALLADYQRGLALFTRLTNPHQCLAVADLVGVKHLDANKLVQLCAEKKVNDQAVALYPPSSSRETELFDKLFPNMLPANVDLMKELIRRLRSGEVDLKPNEASGWYEYQVYALETLLLPEKGMEKDKLLLTKSYKERMLEAFKALITKRRETHVRQLGAAKKDVAAPPPPVDSVKPRLRIEPAPSYYLRTARAYAFLANFLEATAGKELLQSLHGLKKDGERSPALLPELHDMRDRFYGFYLVSADDIGLKPALAKDEGVDQEKCYKLATDWLATAFDDPDLAVDTRVLVPIFVDVPRQKTRVWVTLGVRLTKLEARYARPPQLKPANGSLDWKEVEPGKLEGANYLIAVDEFAEVELNGLKVLSREELRKICDEQQTKEKIIEALAR
jgi:hypothetical protein